MVGRCLVWPIRDEERLLTDDIFSAFYIAIQKVLYVRKVYPRQSFRRILWKGRQTWVYPVKNVKQKIWKGLDMAEIFYNMRLNSTIWVIIRDRQCRSLAFEYTFAVNGSDPDSQSHDLLMEYLDAISAEEDEEGAEPNDPDAERNEPDLCFGIQVKVDIPQHFVEFRNFDFELLDGYETYFQDDGYASNIHRENLKEILEKEETNPFFEMREYTHAVQRVFLGNEKDEIEDYFCEEHKLQVDRESLMKLAIRRFYETSSSGPFLKDCNFETFLLGFGSKENDSSSSDEWEDIPLDEDKCIASARWTCQCKCNKCRLKESVKKFVKSMKKGKENKSRPRKVKKTLKYPRNYIARGLKKSKKRKDFEPLNPEVVDEIVKVVVSKLTRDEKEKLLSRIKNKGMFVNVEKVGVSMKKQVPVETEKIRITLQSENFGVQLKSEKVGIRRKSDLARVSSEFELEVVLWKDGPEVGPSKDELEVSSSEDDLEVGSSEDDLEVGPSEDELEVGPSEDELEVGPSEDELEVGPSEDELEVGTSQDELESGLSEDEAVPSGEESEAGHSEDELEAGPSIIESEEGRFYFTLTPQKRCKVEILTSFDRLTTTITLLKILAIKAELSGGAINAELGGVPVKAEIENLVEPPNGNYLSECFDFIKEILEYLKIRRKEILRSKGKEITERELELLNAQSKCCREESLMESEEEKEPVNVEQEEVPRFEKSNALLKGNVAEQVVNTGNMHELLSEEAKEKQKLEEILDKSLKVGKICESVKMKQENELLELQNRIKQLEIEDTQLPKIGKGSKMEKKKKKR